MDSAMFKAERVTRSYRQTIHASPETVFPLLCPVREAEWLDGWEVVMIYSASGLVETGAVFSTAQAGEADTIWVVTRHDPEQRVVEFTRFTPGSRTCVLIIRVTPRPDHGSWVDITYTYTGISPAGNAFLDDFSEEAFLDAVTFWEESMNHFLNTGKRLKKRES